MNWKIALLGIVLLLPGCTKIELPPPDDGLEVPLFQLSWDNASGATTELAAGVMGYRVVSEPVLNSEGTWVLSSRMEETDCFEQCGPSIEFILFDLEVDTDGQVDPNLLSTGLSYPFAGGIEIIPGDTTGNGWLVQLEGLTEGTGAFLDYVWVVEQDSMVTFIGQEIEFQVEDPTPFEVCLSHNNPASSCVSDQCKTIVPSNGPTGLSTQILYTSPNGAGLVAETFGGAAPYSFFWSTGETAQEITLNTPGSFGVTVMDSNGQEASSTVNVPQQPATPLCSANFNYSFDSQLVITPGDTIAATDFGSVEVLYTDESGIVFSSRNSSGSPNANTFFVIDSVSPFANDSNGQVLDFRFRVELEDEDGNVIVLENGAGSLVFVLP